MLFQCDECDVCCEACEEQQHHVLCFHGLEKFIYMGDFWSFEGGGVVH